MAADRTSLSAELRFLLEDKEVHTDVQDALARAGFNTLPKFALLEDTRDAVRKILKEEFSLDPSTDPANRLKQITVIDC